MVSLSSSFIGKLLTREGTHDHVAKRLVVGDAFFLRASMTGRKEARAEVSKVEAKAAQA